MASSETDFVSTLTVSVMGESRTRRLSICGCSGRSHSTTREVTGATTHCTCFHTVAPREEGAAGLGVGVSVLPLLVVLAVAPLRIVGAAVVVGVACIVGVAVGDGDGVCVAGSDCGLVLALATVGFDELSPGEVGAVTLLGA